MGRKDAQRLIDAAREELGELQGLSGFRFYQRLPIIERLIADLRRHDRRAAKDVEGELAILKRNAASIGGRAMRRVIRVRSRKARSAYSDEIDPREEKEARDGLKQTAKQLRDAVRELNKWIKEAESMAKRKPWSNRDLEDAIELEKGIWYLVRNEIL